MQYLAAASHAVRAYVGDPRSSDDAGRGPAPWDVGVAYQLETFNSHHLCRHASFAWSF